MRLFYKLLYGVGFTPWEGLPGLPAAKQVYALLDREVAGREPPYGQALDLGCGSGIWAVELAKRGGRSQVSTSSQRPFKARASGHARLTSRFVSLKAT